MNIKGLIEAAIRSLKTFVEFEETTKPSNPAANKLRMYTKDDGFGNTHLYVLDSAGAERNLSIGAGGGEVNTVSNIGTAGVGIYKQKVGVDFELKKLNAGSSKVTITDDVPNNEVDVDIVEANIDHGSIGGLTDDDHTQYQLAYGDSAGVVYPPPSWTDNLDGTADIGSCYALLYNNSNYDGRLSRYLISASAGLTFTDASINYIVIDYNSGAPQYQVTTSVVNIDESDQIPVISLFRNGTTLRILSWDSLANGMSNRLHARLVKTQRFARESGLALSEKGTREVAITAGKTWHGAVTQNLLAFDSAVDVWSFWYHVAGVWTQSLATTQYNNNEYDNGTNLVVLGSNKYTVNWVYRFNSDSIKQACYVLGNQEYNSLAEARLAQTPSSLPPNIQGLAILVGRIIVVKGGTTGEISSAFTTSYTAGTVTNHNDLSSLQGGGAGDYQHLTTSELANSQKCELYLPVGDEDTDLTLGTAKLTFRMPYAMTVTGVRASVKTAPTDANIEVDINEGGVSILSTVISIDATEKTSTTAATPPVISDSALANDAEITIDIDQVGSTIAGTGLKVWIIGTRA